MAPNPRKATRGMRWESGCAVTVEEETAAVEIGKMPRLRISVQIEGLLSVHAVRAVRTALGGVPGVLTAHVSLAGAELEADRPVTEEELATALEPAGVTVRGVTVQRGTLPLA